ncbi:hypothetical protein LY76DRAFT_281923 [Colletotrichum caudatum]|nr:hypothetical protein LY76DRAFT_281923 [Colletotrichum caudatum]
MRQLFLRYGLWRLHRCRCRIVCPRALSPRRACPFSPFGASNRLLTRGRTFRYVMASQNNDDDSKPICSVKPGRRQSYVLCFLCWRVKGQTLLEDNTQKRQKQYAQWQGLDPEVVLLSLWAMGQAPTLPSLSAPLQAYHPHRGTVQGEGWLVQRTCGGR